MGNGHSPRECSPLHHYEVPTHAGGDKRTVRCKRALLYIYIYSGVGRCQKVGGGGGGAQRHVIYVPLAKNQYK